MTTKFIPLALENGQEIMIEVTDKNIKGGFQQVNVTDKAIAQIGDIETKIRNISKFIMRSIDNLATDSNSPDRVSVEFSITFGAETGFPAIAQGKVEAGIIINMEWQIKNEGVAK